MYSHELQTCDWPRNVGCGEAGESATVSTVRVTDPRTRQTTPAAAPPARSTPGGGGGGSAAAAAAAAREQRRQQDEIAKQHQLYADDIGPAEEIENDRQQRVYRGQPSTIGQVARDRDGLRHQPVTNSIPISRSSSAEKVSVISFGTQQQTQNTQYRYPARIVQIVPSGARVPWPTSPSPTVHNTGSGGNFKYQGNLNRNKPPRLTDPAIPPEPSYQSALNPSISPTDIRNFRSPEQYANSKLRPPPNYKFSNPDSHYGHRPPPDPEDQFRPHRNQNEGPNKRPHSTYKTSSNNKPHSGGLSSPVHSVVVPSSYSTFQNLPEVPSHVSSPTSLVYNQSFISSNPQAHRSVFSNAGAEEPFSYFHSSGNTDAQSSHLSTTPSVPLFSAAPTLANLLSSLKNAEILAGHLQQQTNLRNQGNPNEQNVNFIKSLTSLHEVPYNSDGTRLYQLQAHHISDLPLNNDYTTAQLLQHLVSQTNPSYPGINNFQSQENSPSLPSNQGNYPSLPATTTQRPFTPVSNAYGLRYVNQQKEIGNQHGYEQNKSPHRFAKPQNEYEPSEAKRYPNLEHSTTKPGVLQRPLNRPSSEYSSSEEDYYDDSTEESLHAQVPQAPINYFTSNNNNKYKNNDNPFADVNFDFDKYIDKLRGQSQTKLSVTSTSRPVKNKQTSPVSYEKPEDYDDYSEEDEYDDYEESSEKANDYRKKPQFNAPEGQTFSPQNVPQYSSTESTSYTNGKVNETKYRNSQGSGHSSAQNVKPNPSLLSKVPETLTVPFYHGPDGNFYSRPTVQTVNINPEKSTFSVPQNVHHTNSTKHTFTYNRDLPKVPLDHEPQEQTTKSTYDNGNYRLNLKDTNVKNVPSLVYNAQHKINSHAEKTITTNKPSTNIENSEHNYFDDFVYSTGPVKSREHSNKENHSTSIEPTHIRLLTTKNYNNLPSTSRPVTSVLYSSNGDVIEYASSTTTYPRKTKQGTYTHAPDSTIESITTEGSRLIHNPGKTINHSIKQTSNKDNLRYVSGGQISQLSIPVLFNSERHNSTTYREGTNIFSSVNDAISMMTSSSSIPPNIQHTTLSPQKPETEPPHETYTIRRRPPKAQVTTPRYRIRKPTTSSPPSSPSAPGLDGQITTSLPRPETNRPHRRPVSGTKYRIRTTTTTTSEHMTRITDSEVTDRPKPIVNRQNKKQSSDKEGSRTTNNIRVEPSPSPVSFVQQPSLQASPSPSVYNSTQQYDPAQYDPYYSLYDEDVELYRDVDYSQYTSNQGQTGNQQYRGQSPYKQAPQQPEIQAQRNPYAQPTYNTQNVYTQSVGNQDYNDNYNSQLANDQLQYRQQSARQPTKAPPSSDRTESILSHETMSTTTIPSTSTNPTKTSTSTTTVTTTESSSRLLTRQRGEITSSVTPPTTRGTPITTSTTTTTTTTTTTARTIDPSTNSTPKLFRDIPEEFQTLWNLPVQPKSIAQSSSPANANATIPRKGIVARTEISATNQKSFASSSSTSEQKPASRRITLTASLSLDDPFSNGRPKNQASIRNTGTLRRVPVNSDEFPQRSSYRRGSSEIVNISASPQSSRTGSIQVSPRRTATKSFTIAETPNTNTQTLSRNLGIITVDETESQPSKLVSNSSTPVRGRLLIRVPNPDESHNFSRAAATRPEVNAETPKFQIRSQEPREAISVDNYQKSTTVALKPTVESIEFPYSESDSNSITSSPFHNALSQSNIGTSRGRSKPCRDEVETNSNSECSEKPQLRVRPTTAPPDSQITPGTTRVTVPVRNRGNVAYTVSTASDTVNRGTPASVRSRPTLKPSTAIVPKAQEFIDIYRYPARRPDPIYPTPQVDKTAAKCRKDVCLLPDCYCGGKDIPGDLRAEEIPQIVLLTFDDAVNDLNKGLYSDLFEKGRNNPNGCPISATFYVSHEWTDYSQVQNLYADGHEMASHSVSHSFGEQFSQKKWTKEIGGQREILSAYGGVKLEDVRGMRAPFLAIGGNKMFKMLYDSNFTYDSSMPVYENRPPSWPYTLDYKIFHDCMIPPCPTRSYPGVWEVPMVMWQDLNGGRCSMGDACSNPPTADGVYKMLIKNFERHYTTNRAPFGLFYHAAWFTQPHHKEGFEAFLDTIVSMPDVWLVTNWQAIQWIRDPTPLSRINTFQHWQCNYPDRPKKCNNPKVCNLWHKSGVRYMRTCQPCPDIYPWTGKTGVRNSRVDNEVIEE